MSVKINSLELENVKRIKAVRLSPEQNGLTVIGGDNNQGKTSVLDALAWALCGDRYRPTDAKREGAYDEPFLKVTLNNGITVERRGKNGTLKVTDPSGKKAGQALLDSFLCELALNLPKFMTMTDKEKADVLLSIIGVGEKLSELDRKIKRLYDERHGIGCVAEQKKKYALELVHYDGVPSAPVSAIELIRKQQDILARNGENRRKRENAEKLAARKEELEEKLRALSAELAAVSADLLTAKKSAEELIDESTAELEKSIADIDGLNIRIRANLDKERATEEAFRLEEQYNALSAEIEEARRARTDLLSGARLPLPELSVEEGSLVYRGKHWDCLSASEQLKVGTAIVRAVSPECGFVLVDKLEQMDRDTLESFGTWCREEGLQVIATRVSKGDECSVIIEDGYSVEPEESTQSTKTWKDGEF